MAKFYVESGKLQLVVMAGNREEAAVKAVQFSCDQRDTVHPGNKLEDAQYPVADPAELHDDIFVSEKGFGRDDAVRFDTLETVALWQGYAFPWDEHARAPTSVDAISR
jgi:hypothetical protein